ncbi:MAG TPA: transglycosylase domain-containing protein [Bacteroidales bacterium]|jgi:penicillin-binding protein 1A|nr:penicillin-binding protein [Bacteroidales bacterium]HNR43245.1 transglycosylase domain-containing protein [Bacteroidales bacterium]HQG76549.1 transglycosylase domain-containing protein [Bacteroidales bacterium]
MKSTNPDRKYIVWFWCLFTVPFIVIFLLFLLISRGKLGPMPSFRELENPEYYLAAEVFSEDGVLLGKISIENRTWTEYKDLSPYLVDALIATEDIRYYRHSGIDVRGLGRTIVRTILLGQNTGGGSTITQQLAKQLYPRDTAKISAFVRNIRLGVTKFKEWQTAIKLERSYTKEEIIAMYLNKFDFLYNAIGIRSAARVYFNTTPDSLNLQEAAVLVGMLKNSARYNPVRNYDLMVKRRNVVLSQLAKYGYINPAIIDSVKQLPIETDFHLEDHNTGLATYLREYLRNTMRRPEPDINRYERESSYRDALWEWENNPLYGWCNKNRKPDGSNYDIYRDGLKIYTTINSRMQLYAEEALREHLSKDVQPGFYRRAKSFRNPPYSNDISKKEVEELIMRSLKESDRYYVMKARGVPEDSIMLAFNTPVKMRVFSWKGERDTVMTPYDSVRYYKYFIRSAFLVEDPHTGYVKAYVGGPDFRYFKWDAVTQQRKQVGSTIKPFLYTIAMQNGYSPCYEVENIPRSFDIPGDSVPWIPRSSGPKEYHGKMVTLKWGLAQSENYISAWLMEQFSPSAVTDLMKRMGIRSYIDPVPSIFLGTSDIKLEEMVGAYGTYANKGVYIRPMYVTRIEDKNGNVISRFTPMIEEVLSEEQAYLMLDLLRGVVLNGSGNRIRRVYNLMNQIGGKTGTTQNHSNGWFMGITPDLVGGVWSGWEDQAIHFETLGEGQGANMALPIFALFLKKVYADPQFGILEANEFERPANFSIELDCEKVKRESSRRLNYKRERY